MSMEENTPIIAEETPVVETPIETSPETEPVTDQAETPVTSEDNVDSGTTEVVE